MDLDTLWFSLTKVRHNVQLEGWGSFFREHLAEISDALGSRFPATKASFELEIADRREILARYVPPPTLGRRLLKSASAGPVGWIVAGVLILWHLIK
jgi:hypothetical protein